MPLAQTVSQVQKLHCRRHFWDKVACSPKRQKDFYSADVLSTSTNISSLLKALETTPFISMQGMVTTQSSHAQRDTCAKPSDSALLFILKLKLPGNVAHGDHARHVHSACSHTMTLLPAHPRPAETPSSTLLIARCVWCTIQSWKSKRLNQVKWMRELIYDDLSSDIKLTSSNQTQSPAK